MRLVKYISITLFFALLFVMQIESRQANLMQIESFFHQDMPPKEDMGGLEAAIKIAREHQVGIFFVVRNTPSALRTEIDIYADEASRQVLKVKGFGEGEYASLFSGTTVIRFLSLEPDAFQYSDGLLCLVGEEKQIWITVKNFHPLEPSALAIAPKQQTMSFSIRMLWIGLGVFSVLMTWLEIQFGKKTFLLKMLSGASAFGMMLRDIVLDLTVYLTIFELLFRIFSQSFYFSGTEEGMFHFLLIGLLLLNTLAHLISLKVSYKEVFYGANISLNRMGDCFILKSCVLGAGFMLLALMGPSLSWGLRTLGEYEETKYYEDYVFLDIMPLSGDRDELFLRYSDTCAAMTKLYMEALVRDKLAMASRCQIPIWVEENSMEIDEDNTAFIYLVNSHTKGIEKLLSSEEQAGLKGRLLVLYPASSEPEEALLNNVKRYLSSALPFIRQDYLELRSYDSFRLLAFTEEWDKPYMLVQNPLMVFVGAAGEFLESGEPFIRSLSGLPFLQMEEADSLVAEYGMKTSTRSLPEYCFEASADVFRKMIFSFSILTMLLFLEVLLLLLTTRFEYLIKARELAIKRILGYRIIEQNLELFVLNTVSTLIAGAAILSICMINKIAPWYYILSGVLAVLLFEYAILYIICTCLACKNTPSILKGGSL